MLFASTVAALADERRLSVIIERAVGQHILKRQC